MQRLFYGDRSRALLIVLQGIDGAGKDGTCWHVISAMDPAGREGAGLQAADARRAGARLPLAGASARAGQGRGRGLQSLALRGRAGRARAQASAEVRLEGALRLHQPVGEASSRGQQHDDPEILSLHLEGRAARQVQGAARRSWTAMEDQRVRLQGTRLLGRLHRRVRGCADKLLEETRAVVRHPIQPQMVPQSRGIEDHRRLPWTT